LTKTIHFIFNLYLKVDSRSLVHMTLSSVIELSEQ